MSVAVQRVLVVVLSTVLAGLLLVVGGRALVGYTSCHQQVEQAGGGLLEADYDPVTGLCTAHFHF